MSDRTELLAHLLTESQQRLYHRSAEFKQAVDVLVLVYLPAVLEGLATSAMLRKTAFDEEVAKSLQATPTLTSLSDIFETKDE